MVPKCNPLCSRYVMNMGFDVLVYIILDAIANAAKKCVRTTMYDWAAK